MELSLEVETGGRVEAALPRLVQTYRIIRANSLPELEERVQYALEQTTATSNDTTHVHGDIQEYNGNEFVQVLIGYKYISEDK